MTAVYERLQNCYKSIQDQICVRPKVALVLGSGLGDYADGIQIESTLDYHEISGFPVSTVSATEENANSKYFKRQYPLGMGVSNMQDEIFSIQRNIIEDLAKKESCIIVGRCAESILADVENRLNVYIYAPFERRLKNCTEILKMEEKVARKMIREVDRSRELYHRRYCPEYTDVFSNRDMMVDSSRFGIERTAQILAGLARNMFEE